MRGLLAECGLLAVQRVLGQAAPSGGGDARRRRDTADSEAAEKQAPMTKEQAKELFRSVDEILNFVSKDYEAADRAQREAEADLAG